MTPPLVSTRKKKKEEGRLAVVRVMQEHYEAVMRRGLGYLTSRVGFLERLMGGAESEGSELVLSKAPPVDPRY